MEITKGLNGGAPVGKAQGLVVRSPGNCPKDFATKGKMRYK